MNNSEKPIVGLNEIRRYLVRHGWSQVEHPNKRIQLFETKPDHSGDFSSLTLPTSDDFTDATEIVREAIHIISNHESKPVENILDRLLRWGRDILRARLIKIHGQEHSIPLVVAAETIARLKEFMGYAAYTQFQPKPFFDKAGSVSSEFTKQCRFGHTFHGSFGLTVECPFQVTPMLPMDGNVPVIPFERQVFERIACGLGTLRECIENETVEPMIQGYPVGFSANMCRSLAEVYEGGDGRRVEYDISWNIELPTSCEANSKPFLFEGRAYEMVRVAAEALEKVEEIPDSVVEGPVVALRSDTPPGLDQQGEFEHLITMYWDREKEQTVQIRVPLSAAQYILACDAHKEGKRIRIYGVPEKVGKNWTLTKPHDFTVL